MWADLNCGPEGNARSDDESQQGIVNRTCSQVLSFNRALVFSALHSLWTIAETKGYQKRCNNHVAGMSVALYVA